MDQHLMSEEDSEPEEIDTKTSKQSMIKTFDNQKKVIRDLNKFNKIKRKQINDKYVEQKINKQINIKGVERLSEHLLNEVNFEAPQKSKPEDKQINHKLIEKKRPKKKKSFKFETQSTTFDVLDVSTDLPQLTAIKAKSKKNAINFKDNMIFDKRRNRRISSSKQKSFSIKQSVYKK